MSGNKYNLVDNLWMFPETFVLPIVFVNTKLALRVFCFILFIFYFHFVLNHNMNVWSSTHIIM